MKELLPDDDRPDLATDVYVDGTEVCVWTCNNTKAKAHRPDPESADDDEPLPSCHNEHNRFKQFGDMTFRFETVEVTEAWRDPCKVCFPEHYEEVEEEDGRHTTGPVDARKLDDIRDAISDD